MKQNSLKTENSQNSTSQPGNVDHYEMLKLLTLGKEIKAYH